MVRLTTQRLGWTTKPLIRSDRLTISACSVFDVIERLVPDTGYWLGAGIPYGVGARRKLDVYRPATALKLGTPIVFLYGGNWHKGNRCSYRFIGQMLMSRGYLVIIPDYRLYPEVTFRGLSGMPPLPSAGSVGRSLRAAVILAGSLSPVVRLAPIVPHFWHSTEPIWNRPGCRTVPLPDPMYSIRPDFTTRGRYSRPRIRRRRHDSSLSPMQARHPRCSSTANGAVQSASGIRRSWQSGCAMWVTRYVMCPWRISVMAVCCSAWPNRFSRARKWFATSLILSTLSTAGRSRLKLHNARRAPYLFHSKSPLIHFG